MTPLKIFVTGAAGFIGSHLVDELIRRGHTVYGWDNLLTGDMANVNPKCLFIEDDISNITEETLEGIDVVFHLAAIARTQWCIDYPEMAHAVNATGTLKVLEAARQAGVKRFIHSSSCIVYIPTTPYYVSKLAAEEYVRIYHDLYDLNTIALRYSNVYGSLRQSEKGEAINCFASLRKTKRETGRIWLTGDGTQSRDFIHVEDVVEANILAMISNFNGYLDICTGKQTSMNEVAQQFGCPIDYIEPRKGDAQELVQDPRRAGEVLNFVAHRKLEDNLHVYTD